MSITAGQDIVTTDFINESERDAIRANDSGRSIKLESDGFLSNYFIKNTFGGDGSDGVLSISSGTTTLDAAGARVLVKNYTSISITGTASLTISNPHTDGTILILKSLGDVTITSSGVGINLAGKGGAGGTAGVGNTGGAGNMTSGGNGGNGTTLFLDEASGGAGGGLYGAATAIPGTAGEAYIGFYSLTEHKLFNGIKSVKCGSGGGGGGGSVTTVSSTGSAGAAGGAGGGSLIIECNGVFNFTTGSISTAGEAGSDAPNVVNSDEAAGGGGGGGGSAGMILIMYRSLTANSGSYTMTAGNGGKGGDADGNAGTTEKGGSGGGGGGSIGGDGGLGGEGSVNDSGPGNAGTAGATGAGGGGGGGATSVGAAYSGGGGGTAGATAESIHKLVAQNIYF